MSDPKDVAGDLRAIQSGRILARSEEAAGTVARAMTLAHALDEALEQWGRGSADAEGRALNLLGMLREQLEATQRLLGGEDANG